MNIKEGDIYWVKCEVIETDHDYGGFIELQSVDGSKINFTSANNWEEFESYMKEDLEKGYIVKETKAISNSVKKANQSIIKEEIKQKEKELKELQKKLEDM